LSSTLAPVGQGRQNPIVQSTKRASASAGFTSGRRHGDPFLPFPVEIPHVIIQSMKGCMCGNCSSSTISVSGVEQLAVYPTVTNSTPSTRYMIDSCQASICNNPCPFRLPWKLDLLFMSSGFLSFYAQSRAIVVIII
jgi:hypothetical protein